MESEHSSKRLLTGIVGVFVVLMASTALVLAMHAPQPLTVNFVRPGASLRPAPVAYSGEDGKSALELLRAHVHITTQQSSYGEYIDTINGVHSGTNGKYWALYVNGKQTPIAANNYITHDSDKVEWRFE